MPIRVWVRTALLLLLFALARTTAFAASIVIAWDPSTNANTVGYRIHYGTASGQYGTTIAVGDLTLYRLDNLTAGQTYYLIVDAYTPDGATSGASNELVVTPSDVSSTDTTPPTVVSVSPIDASINVAATAALAAVFSEALDSSTINMNTFQLRSASGALVAGAVTYDGTRTAAFTPAAPLAALTWYSATLAGGTTDPRVKDLAGNALASTVTFSFTTAPAPDVTPPTVSILSPVAGTTVAGTITLSATATDNVDVAGVQFILDNAPAGVELLSAPYSLALNTTSLANGTHTISAAARDTSGNASTAPTIAISVLNDLAPPTVVITQPSGGAVGVMQTITATASDDVGVAGVQFFLDNAPIGQEAIASPFSIVWQTTTAAPGLHTLTALARDAAGHTTMSAPVSVTVQNTTVHVPAGSFSLAWDPSPSANVAGYRVRYGSTPLAYTTIIDAGANFATQLNGLPAGQTYYFVVDAYDAAGDASGPSNQLTVIVDAEPTPPTVTTSGNLTLAATSAAGAIASFTASATLADGTSVPVSCAPVSGSMFPLGATTVTCSAISPSGVTGTATLIVAVVDVPPVVITSGNVTIEATGPLGATAAFSASATDIVDGIDPVTCTPGSGSTFAIGTTTVTCVAVDAHGQTGSAQLTVSVRDTTPPAITTSGNVTISATSSSGAIATFSASATDIVDGTDAAVCVPSSGSTFPVGTTTVTCSAIDAHGNTASATLTVTVTDVPPTVTTSGNMTVEATSALGALATFTAKATDIVDGTDSVTCTPASGSIFPIGTTTVTCTAVDAHGQTGSAQLTVTVQDATAPTVTITSPTAGAALGAAVTVSAVASDLVGVVGVQFRLDGVNIAAELTSAPYQFVWNTSTVANGSHTLSATARDAAGNTATAGIKVVKKGK
jgi:Big-like domain-containing protein/HYR domain-containing protein/fibronectin type III domain protein